MKNRRRIGLFGGTFDPPHLAHLIIAETVRERCLLDEIWWMPAWQSPLKTNSKGASPVDRLEMTRLAIQGNACFKLCEAEIHNTTISYTFDTLQKLTSAYSQCEFILIIGADQLANFGKWHRSDEIMKLVPVVVYPRNSVGNLVVRNEWKERVELIDVPRIDLSSTEIRRRVKQKKSLRYQVPESVRLHIYKNKLYLH